MTPETVILAMGTVGMSPDSSGVETLQFQAGTDRDAA